MAQDAFELALAALARKERTVAELRAWLEARGREPAEVEATVDRLVEIGELDDERFARRYAEDKRELRGWGAERIRTALADRGLDAELIDRAAGEPDAAGELERAVALLERRGEGLETEVARRRALDHLVRRGYTYEVAYAAVRAARRAA